jgi:hypothetical protein
LAGFAGAFGATAFELLAGAAARLGAGLVAFAGEAALAGFLRGSSSAFAGRADLEAAALAAFAGALFFAVMQILDVMGARRAQACTAAPRRAVRRVLGRRRPGKLA